MIHCVTINPGICTTSPWQFSRHHCVFHKHTQSTLFSPCLSALSICTVVASEEIKMLTELHSHQCVSVCFVAVSKRASWVVFYINFFLSVFRAGPYSPSHCMYYIFELESLNTCFDGGERFLAASWYSPHSVCCLCVLSKNEIVWFLLKIYWGFIHQNEVSLMPLSLL